MACLARIARGRQPLDLEVGRIADGDTARGTIF